MHLKPPTLLILLFLNYSTALERFVYFVIVFMLLSPFYIKVALQYSLCITSECITFKNVIGHIKK